MVLTADGRAVLPKIEKLCAAHHSLMQTVEGLKDMDSGLVKIATFSSVSAQWLPRILKSFGKVYPNIEFEVVTGDFYDQIEGLDHQRHGGLRFPAAAVGEALADLRSAP